jgi:hypothetical protein
MPAISFVSLHPLGEGVRRTDDGGRGHGPLLRRHYFALF